MTALFGTVFGRLSVLRTWTSDGRRRAECRCSCGATKIVRVDALRRGTTISCGCVLRGAHTHGHASHVRGRSATYRSWRSMLDRCHLAAHAKFSYYGGRGIAVCERWQDFETFLADMGERPAGTSLDRIDSNGNYEPTNCRWATREEQSRNRRASPITESVVLEIHGRVEHGESLTSVAARLGIDRGTVYQIRSGRRWSEYASHRSSP